MKAQRKIINNVSTLQCHFEIFKIKYRELEIKRENLYNINKTSFRIDCDRSTIVIILKFKKKLIITNSNNRNYISSIECIDISIDDFSLLAYIIITRA